MDDLDSSWNESLESLDSDLPIVSFDIDEAMNGFDQIELSKQVQEMRDDPTLPFPVFNLPNVGVSEKPSSSNDVTSLSSEIFMATRLLHDDTLLDTTMLPVLEDNTSPYSDSHNINSFLESPFENDIQQENFVMNSFPQRENFNSGLLSDHGDVINPSPRLDYDSPDKSWAVSASFSEIMPAPLQTIPKKKVREKKSIEKKKISVSKVQKKIITSQQTNAELRPSPEPHQALLHAPAAVALNSSSAKVTKELRKVPAYLKKYHVPDNQYPEVFACKNCPGFFTTLDAAMFHPCLKKRRGRRPKILQDCVIPT